jgi:hypothetical protein
MISGQTQNTRAAGQGGPVTRLRACYMRYAATACRIARMFSP